jgi:glycosyltransferase involved in cell wall biosynthesis
MISQEDIEERRQPNVDGVSRPQGGVGRSAQDGGRATKDVLVVAQGFPGLGGRGVGLLNRLPEYGFCPWVITNRDERRAIGEQAALKSLHPDIRVISTLAINRSPFRVFSRLFGWQAAKRYCEALVFVPDLYVVWAISAYLKCKELMRVRDFHAVITISPPESCHLAGLWLKRRTGIPWISNFEDLWSGKRHLFRPATSLHRSLILRMERKIYTGCDRLLANTPGNRSAYVNGFGISSEKVSVLTLGYDGDESRRALMSAKPQPGEFTVGYMGSFDKAGFPFREWLKLFKRLRETNPQLPIFFELCGEISNNTLKEIAELGLAGALRYHGLLPHTEAVAKMAKCDILLLLLYETEYSSSIIPHKLYHYLGLRKPIFALAPERGDVADILTDTAAGAAFSISRLDRGYAWLSERLAEKVGNGSLACALNPAAIERFEFARLAKSLAGELEKCQTRRN